MDLPRGVESPPHSQYGGPDGTPEAYHLGMHRIRNEGVVPHSDGSVAADVLLRQEPDEEEDEEREKTQRKKMTMM